MKYLFVYSYKGKNKGKPENGEGSMTMTVTGTDKVTPKLIEGACEIVQKDLNAKGIQIDVLCPKGWFKYDGEDNDD